MQLLKRGEKTQKSSSLALFFSTYHLLCLFNTNCRPASKNSPLHPTCFIGKRAHGKGSRGCLSALISGWASVSGSPAVASQATPNEPAATSLHQSDVLFSWPPQVTWSTKWRFQRQRDWSHGLSGDHYTSLSNLLPVIPTASYPCMWPLTSIIKKREWKGRKESEGMNGPWNQPEWNGSKLSRSKGKMGETDDEVVWFTVWVSGVWEILRDLITNLIVF